MKALITGIGGFVGSHLTELLLSKNFEVSGIERENFFFGNIAKFENSIRIYECNLLNIDSLFSIVKEVKPDYVFHLAGQSSPALSWVSPVETIENNITAQLNLLEVIKKLNLNTKIQIAGSSEEYGLCYEDEMPIKEDNPLRPINLYGVTKIAQDFMGFQYAKSFGMHIIRTRAFNHIGPRQSENFVASNFAMQIAKIELDESIPPVIKTGNLSVKRDFTDVRDVVKAYLSVLDKGDAGDVYNIASGKDISIKELLECLLFLAKSEIKVEQAPERFRISDIPSVVGDFSKLHKTTGWQPAILLEQTAIDLLNYWRERVKGEIKKAGLSRQD